MKSKITVEFDSKLPPQLYADLANMIWLQMRAMSDQYSRFGFHVVVDSSTTTDELNRHWDELGNESRWGRS